MSKKKKKKGATGEGAAQANLSNEWGIVPAWLTPSTSVWSLADGSSGSRAGRGEEDWVRDKIGRWREEKECVWWGEWGTDEKGKTRLIVIILWKRYKARNMNNNNDYWSWT